MKNFQEISHSGGNIELHFEEPDSVSLEFSNSSSGPAALFQVGVSLDGKRLQYWPFVGMDTRKPVPASPMVPALIISDEEGFFGRSCPKCKSYFRVDHPSELMRCPYCGHEDGNIAFITKNQLHFVDNIRRAFVAAFNARKSITIDLGKLASELPDNRPGWVYSEERQQHQYECAKCKRKYDILGEYAGCPTCGKRNSLQVFEKHIAEVEQEFAKADAEIKDRLERQIEWEKLTRCISDFEAMARDIQTQLLLFPMTPKRRKDLQNLSFQNLLNANEALLKWFGFEILCGVSEDDKIFLNRMFNRRHVLTHNGGRIDQTYLDNTKDSTVRLNEQISVKSKELKRITPLLRTVAQNLFRAFESIS